MSCLDPTSRTISPATVHTGFTLRFRAVAAAVLGSTLCGVLPVTALASHVAAQDALTPASTQATRPVPSFSAALASGELDLDTYAGIDAALEGHALLPLGAIWRFFPGTEEPSVDLEWTSAEFDDSGWRSGPSPFAYGVDVGGTTIEELGQGASSVYLRYVLDVPDPDVFARISFELPIDDGFVFYLNGKEERRRSAGDLDVRRAFDAGASSARATDNRPMPIVDLTPALVPGKNVLALQCLVYPEDAETFEVRPRIRVEHLDDPASEEARVAALRERLAEQQAKPSLVSYLEGRALQRNGQVAAALAPFGLVAAAEPAAPEPWRRIAECHRQAGTLLELEAELRGFIDWGAGTAALMDTWAELLLEDLGRSPLDLVAAVPDVHAPADSRFFADAAWVGRELALGRSVRINCGAAGDQLHGEEPWGRDRFFAVAASARALDAADVFSVDAHVRVASRSLDDVEPTYRIPLPAGAYSLSVTLTDNSGARVDDEEQVEISVGGSYTFDVLVDGARVVREFDPSAVSGGVTHELPIYMEGGFLEIDLLPHAGFDPWIAAIELKPQPDDVLLARFEAPFDSEQCGGAFARVPIARALVAAGRYDDALLTYEQVEDFPDFSARDRTALTGLRTRALPGLASFETVDGLLAHGDLESEALLEALRLAAKEPGPQALYLRGRLDQEAGRLDDAIASFEELVLSGSRAAAPFVRMAQCLAALDLAQEAAGILNEALEGGVFASNDLLSLWIALRLGSLGDDPWDVLADVRRFDPPDELVVVPTSEEAAQPWSYSLIEPPSTTWSRLNFDVSRWQTGVGPLGSGLVKDVIARSLWNTETVFARRTVALEQSALLYPHLRVTANDALDVYLNGTRVLNLGIPVEGYGLFPLRSSAVVPVPGAREPQVLVQGDNGLGMFSNNTEGSGATDVGIVQPIGILSWVADRLEQDGALRINCGGEGFVAPDGKIWSEDRFYGWGQIAFVDPDLPVPDIKGTDNDVLYHTNRWFFQDVSSTWYQVPLPNGSYRVTLHFAELDLDREPGLRVFDVRAEGEPLMQDYDVSATVGFETADVHSFEVAVADGYLDLHVNGREWWSFLSGLEIAR